MSRKRSERARSSTQLHALKGFTLIELLVVVVIIGIIAAIGIPKYANSKSRGYLTVMKTDLRNLVNAQEAFFSDSSRYTTDLASLNWKPSTGVLNPVIAVSQGSWTAIIRHSQLTGKECAIAVNTANPIASVSGEAEPACR